MSVRDGVKVEIWCSNCGTRSPMCIPIDRNVPERLRCDVQYGGGGGRSDIFCSGCLRSCFQSWRELQGKVEGEARGSALRRHLKNGAVIIEC